MEWTQQQADALKAVDKWLKNKRGPQVFRLFGWAGTGKTTLAIHLAEGVDGPVMFCAYTGKAALVMRKKGCTDAGTIHSAIYKVDTEEGDDGDPVFTLNPDSQFRFAKLIIIDEASMVDDELGQDALSFGTKILVLGDPFQLPPVKGDGFFTSAEPDFMLTDIRRQAADNPIIWMSIQVREGRPLVLGDYGSSRIIRRPQLGQRVVMGADQVLCGMNKTRQTLNTRIRQLRGIDSPMPVAGDRLVCLKNNREKGLLNGSLWTADAVTLVHDRVSMTVKSLDGMGDPGKLTVRKEFFLGTEKNLQWYERKATDEMTFGDCLTVHKSQGSQWDNVLLMDESGVFRENRANHLYTGLTRAAERVTIVI